MSAGWAEFAAAFLVFAASHFLPRLGGLRQRLIAGLGRRWYFGVYGGLSLLALVWLIGAAGRAPFVELWPMLPWTRHVPGVVMPVAILLAVSGVATPYPFTLGSARGAVFDPANPGLAALTRHPMLWALALWSASHLLPNGDLAHVLLFGGFAGMSLAGMVIYDGRGRRARSGEMTARLYRAAPVLSPLPLLSLAWLGANGPRLVNRLLIAAAVWGVVFRLHLPVVGVSPVAG